MSNAQSFRLGLVASAAALLVAGCGGGGGSGASGGAVVSGVSFKGPTAGATICAYRVDNAAAGKKGAKVNAETGSTPTVSNGCVITANDGTYGFKLPAGVTSDLIFESTGGTYCSNEAVFDGTSCPSGGTPVAMGANALRTVVSAPADGAAVTAPVTLLTTAAVNNASGGTLTSSSFATAYGTVATNFGLTNKSPASKPEDVAELKTALTKLTDYVGGDTTQLGTIVGSIADGTIKDESGSVGTTTDINCAALETGDLSYTYLFNPSVLASTNLVATQLISSSYTYQLYGFLGCEDTGTDSYKEVLYEFPLATLFAGQPISGYYYEYRYTGGSCASPSRSRYESKSTQMTAQWMGNASLPRSATTDVAYSQSGSVSKLKIVLQPGGSLGLASATTYNHLVCRTRASAPNLPSQVLLTSTTSPVLNGSLSRLNPKSVYTGWTD